VPTGMRAQQVHVVAWYEGRAMWYGKPLTVDEGATVSMPVPITGFLSG
jgi:hypothetical protein